MDAHVHSKLDQVMQWVRHENPENLCMIVLKSNNDAAIAYQLHKNQLIPVFVENSKSSPCSFLDAAMLTADVDTSTNQITFRVNLTDKALFLSKDSENKPAVLLEDSYEGISQWVRLDVLYVDLDRPSHAVIHAYGKTLESKSWTTHMGMDLSKWF